MNVACPDSALDPNGPGAPSTEEALARLAGQLPGFHFALYLRGLASESGLRLVATTGGVCADLPRELPLDAARSAVARAALQGWPVHLARPGLATMLAERILGADPGAAAVALPVRSGGHVAGALCLAGPRGALNAQGFQQILDAAASIARSWEEPPAAEGAVGVVSSEEKEAVRDVLGSGAGAGAAPDLAAGEVVRRERLASLGRLAGGLAHELHNPLAALRSNLDVLVAEVDQLLDGNTGGQLAAFGEMAREALEAAERIEAVVGALRSASHDDRDDRGPVDLGRVVGEAVRLFERANKHVCTVRLEVPPLPRAWTSGAAVAQIALGLLQQGLDAMGGSGELVVRAVVEGGGLAISFIDRGPPLDTSDEAEFDPFCRRKGDPDDEASWSLYVCRQLAERAGGILEWSHGAEGTIFTLIVPPAHP